MMPDDHAADGNAQACGIVIDSPNMTGTIDVEQTIRAWFVAIDGRHDRVADGKGPQQDRAICCWSACDGGGDVDDEVLTDMLQLAAVAENRWQVFAKLRLDANAASLKIMLQGEQRGSDRLVEIDDFEFADSHR